MKIRVSLLLFVISLVFTANIFASRVDTVNVLSAAMGKAVRCVVVVPDGYSKGSDRYPVTYLLHGYSGNYRSWLEGAPEINRYVDEFQMMVVCPDGGYDSWYLDSPMKPKELYETFISKELVQYIDENYKTRADKNHRAITGLSMGGHGALYNAIRHSDVFGAAGSTSGGVDLRPFPKNWNISDKIGVLYFHCLKLFMQISVYFKKEIFATAVNNKLQLTGF